MKKWKRNPSMVIVLFVLGILAVVIVVRYHVVYSPRAIVEDPDMELFGMYFFDFNSPDFEHIKIEGSDQRAVLEILSRYEKVRIDALDHVITNRALGITLEISYWWDGGDRSDHRYVRFHSHGGEVTWSRPRLFTSGFRHFTYEILNADELLTELLELFDLEPAPRQEQVPPPHHPVPTPYI